MSKRSDLYMCRDAAERGRRRAAGGKKDGGEETEEVPQVLLGAPMELTVVRDGVHGFLVGVSGNERYRLLDGPAEAGEVWKCQILPAGRGMMPEAYPISREGRSAAAAVSPGPVREKGRTGRKTAAPVREREDSELGRKLSDKTAKLNAANLRIGRMQRQINGLEKLREENRQKDSAIRSLKTQVQQLETKLKPRNMEGIIAERDGLRAKVEDQEEEIRRLRDILSLYSTGVRRSAVTTYLTGATSIHCNLLEDKGYRVYFSPGRKTLRFVPDVNGTFGRDGRDVVIPAIRQFTDFEKIRSLEARKEEGEVVVSLV